LPWTGYANAVDYVDEPAVTDTSTPGHLITAVAMQPVAFAREIFAELDLYTPEVLAAWFRLYSGDPAGYHDRWPFRHDRSSGPAERFGPHHVPARRPVRGRGRTMAESAGLTATRWQVPRCHSR
jgi:hypothetical protein